LNIHLEIIMTLSSQNDGHTVKIEETMKITFYIVIFIIIALWIFILTVSFTIIPNLGEQYIIIVNIVIWVIGGIATLIILYTIQGFLKIRYFTLSNESIEFEVPYKPKFVILWKDIRNIKVTKKTVVTGKVRRKFFILSFDTKEEEKVFKLEKGRDFRFRTANQILLHIEEYANKLNKQYLQG